MADNVRFNWNERLGNARRLLPVVNQADSESCNCKSCWSIAGNHAVSIGQESLPVLLSSQELCDNVPLPPRPRGRCCRRNKLRNAYAYTKLFGVSYASEYPLHSPGWVSDSGQRIRIADFEEYDALDEDEMNALIRAGPIAAVIPCVDRLGVIPGTEIYRGPMEGEKVTEYHSVLIVGYDQEGDDKYFIYQSSWGEGWGDGGFGRVARDVPCDFIVPVHPHVGLKIQRRISPRNLSRRR